MFVHGIVASACLCNAVFGIHSNVRESLNLVIALAMSLTTVFAASATPVLLFTICLTFSYSFISNSPVIDGRLGSKNPSIQVAGMTSVVTVPSHLIFADCIVTLPSPLTLLTIPTCQNSGNRGEFIIAIDHTCGLWEFINSSFSVIKFVNK